MSLKYLSDFWKTLEMPLINCEINCVVQWYKSNRICNNWYKTLCPTWSTQDNTKLLQQLKSSFKRKINYNKYQSKVSVRAIKSYVDYWIDPSFQGENKLFVLLFENTENRTVTQKILSSKSRN